MLGEQRRGARKQLDIELVGGAQAPISSRKSFLAVSSGKPLMLPETSTMNTYFT